MPFDILICLFPHLPPYWGGQLANLGAAGEKCVFLAVFHTTGVAGYSLTAFPHLCKKASHAALGRDGAFKFPLIYTNVSKLGSHSPAPNFFFSFLLFLLQWSARISIWEGWTFIFLKGPLIHFVYPKQHSLGFLQPRLKGTGVHLPDLAGFTICRDIYLPIHMWNSPGSLGIWCWIPQLPQRYLCS